MKILTQKNKLNMFKLHINNLKNFKITSDNPFDLTYFCLENKLAEICLNMSLILNENILQNDNNFMLAYDLIEEACGTDFAEFFIEDLVKSLDLIQTKNKAC